MWSDDRMPGFVRAVLLVASTVTPGFLRRVAKSLSLDYSALLDTLANFYVGTEVKIKDSLVSEENLKK